MKKTTQQVNAEVFSLTGFSLTVYNDLTSMGTASKLIILGFLLIATFFVWQKDAFAWIVINRYGQIERLDNGDLLATPFEALPGQEKHSVLATSPDSVRESVEEIVDESNDNSSANPPGQLKDKIENQAENRAQVQKRIEQIAPPDKANIVRLTHTENNRIQIERDGDSESTPSAEVAVEDPADKNTTKIRSDGRFYNIIRDKVAAKTKFPLSVNLDTNELIVITPAGTKVVTVLPDRAVETMLAANVLDQAGGKGGSRWLISQQEADAQATESAVPTATSAAELQTIYTPEEPDIELVGTEDGTIAYEIPGVKYKEVFGLFKIRLDRKALVSAETGELLKIQQSFFDKVLSFLSTG